MDIFLKKYVFPLDFVFESLFKIELEKKYPWLKYLWMGMIYFFGIYMWGKFMSWDTLTLNFYDWGKLNTPRLLFLQNAYQSAQWPLHMAGTTALLGFTDRFFVLPDVVLTPQTILLLFVKIPTFVMIDILINYSIGFIGLWLLRKRFQFSLFSFSALFFLFMFNGHILAHYSVGHFNWGAYFLFPLVFWYLFRFLDGEQGWRWVACFSFVMFYMVLAGGWHHVLWILIFLGVLIIFCLRRSLWLIAVGIFSLLLSAVRLLPPVVDIKTFTDTNIFTMVLGYPTFAEVLESMLFLRRPIVSPSDLYHFNLYGYEKFYWEFNFYLGVIGTGFIMIFGLYFWLKEKKPDYRHLIGPSFFLVALSIGSTFWLVRLSGIPLFGGERVTSRMVSLPLVLLMVMATLIFQKYINQNQPNFWHRMIAVSVLVLFVIDLYNNLRIWRFSESARIFGDNMIDLSGSIVANHPDAAYTTSLIFGLSITILTALILMGLSLWEQKKRA